MAKNLCIGLGAFLLIFVLYLWRLGNLTPGLSPHESAARIASGTIDNIIQNPINAPHKIFQFLFQLLGYHGAFWMRSVSVLFALAILVSLFLILRACFGRFIAITGLIIFASTPWFILVSRNASPDIMFLFPFVLVISYLALRKSEKLQNLKWAVFIISLAICLYIPGTIWLLVAIFIFGNKQIVKNITKLDGFIVVAGLTALLLLIAPLGYSFVAHSNLIYKWLLIPESLPDLAAFINALSDSFTSLFFQFNEPHDYIIGTFPIVTVVQTTLMIIGLFGLWIKARKVLIIVLTSLLIGVILTALNENLFLLTLCLPAIAILDAAGLRYLYKKWFTIFPLNPIARWFCLTLIMFLTFGQLLYGFRYAILAWPHSTDTRKTYVIK